MAGGVHDDGGGVHGRGACVAMVGGVCGKGGMCAMHALHNPPPGRYYRIGSMSGRYASYWKAFLFFMCNHKMAVKCPNTYMDLSISCQLLKIFMFQSPSTLPGIIPNMQQYASK